MFGRVTITLGIGPHSRFYSSLFSYILYIVSAFMAKRIMIIVIVDMVVIYFMLFIKMI